MIIIICKLSLTDKAAVKITWHAHILQLEIIRYHHHLPETWVVLCQSSRHHVVLTMSASKANNRIT